MSKASKKKIKKGNTHATDEGVTNKIKTETARTFKIIREKTSRTSLALSLSLFVMLILLAAVLLTTLGIWLLSMAGIFVDIDGDLKIGTIIPFVLLISFIIGGVITFFSSRIPLKPINQIINKMNRLAAGDFKTRLEFGNILSTHPAFKELAQSFNTMAEELQNTEELRSGFINDFSHEFKTPIVSIAGFASLLERGDISEEQRRQYVRAIREESMRLSSMATNVLSLNKVETQTILTDVATFNLSEQLRSAFLLLEDKWTKKNIDIHIDFDEYDIEANEELLKQVWINLIDNAIKFSPDGGAVALDVQNDGELITVKITNSGEEIPPERREKIFHKFYQSDESHATSGNGIGLAIVKRIVELHRGDVTVDCGAGLVTFTVSIPKYAK